MQPPVRMNTSISVGFRTVRRTKTASSVLLMTKFPRMKNAFRAFCSRYGNPGQSDTIHSYLCTNEPDIGRHPQTKSVLMEAGKTPNSRPYSSYPRPDEESPLAYLPAVRPGDNCFALPLRRILRHSPALKFRPWETTGGNWEPSEAV